MKCIKDIRYSCVYDTSLLDIYLPDKDVKNAKVFVYFHGGGLVGGDKRYAEVCAEYLTERGIAVVSANYRMYPDAKYPDFILDAAEAVAWVFDHIKEYGDYDKIYVGGSSAGGYISMMLCFDQSYLAHYGINSDSLAGYVHDAGQPTCHFNVLSERGIDPRRIIVDDSAPIYHVGTRNTSAPMLFIISDNDMVNRYEQTMMMLKTLEHFEYDLSKIQSKVMHGSHCAYVSRRDENRVSDFGKIIYEFIEQY